MTIFHPKIQRELIPKKRKLGFFIPFSLVKYRQDSKMSLY